MRLLGLHVLPFVRHFEGRSSSGETSRSCQGRPDPSVPRVERDVWFLDCLPLFMRHSLHFELLSIDLRFSIAGGWWLLFKNFLTASFVLCRFFALAIFLGSFKYVLVGPRIFLDGVQ